jgi:ATP-dependent DNA helicase RecG
MGWTLTANRHDPQVLGEYPALFVASRVASAVGEKARHIRDRGFDSQYYEDMIVALVREHQPVTREDIDRLLLDKLPEVLTSEQKLNRIHNLLRKLAESSLIVNQGSRRWPKWVPADAGRTAEKSKLINGGER